MIIPISFERALTLRQTLKALTNIILNHFQINLSVCKGCFSFSKKRKMRDSARIGIFPEVTQLESSGAGIPTLNPPEFQVLALRYLSEEKNEWHPQLHFLKEKKLYILGHLLLLCLLECMCAYMCTIIHAYRHISIKVFVLHVHLSD